jgi:hypothetical protein
LGHVGSFLDADTLYPASGALATFLLSGFIPSKCVPLSLTFYIKEPALGERFFFCNIDPGTAIPEEMYLSPVWQQAYGDTKTPLLVLEENE